jgi:hypothetical protein
VICINDRWGSVEWLLEQSSRITDADAATLGGQPGGFGWRAIAERLFLAHERVPEDPEEVQKRLRWRIAWRPEIDKALAWYSLLSRAYRGELDPLPGLLVHDSHSWLGASPHGLTPETVVWVCPHKSLAAFQAHRNRAVPRKLRARLQVLMYVTGRELADVVDVWDPDLDARTVAAFRRRVEYSPEWINGQFLPACKWIYTDVRRLLADAYGLPEPPAV